MGIFSRAAVIAAGIAFIGTISVSAASGYGGDGAPLFEKNEKLREYGDVAKEYRDERGAVKPSTYGKDLGVGWKKTKMTKEQYKKIYGTAPGGRVYQKHRTEDVLPKINYVISLYSDGREGFYQTVPKIREAIVRLKDDIIPKLIAKTRERVVDFEDRYVKNDSTAETFSQCGSLAKIGDWKDLVVKRSQYCGNPCECDDECFCVAPPPCAASRTWSHLESDVVDVVTAGYYPFNVKDVGYPGNNVQFDRYIRQAPESRVYVGSDGTAFIPLCHLDVPDAAQYWKDQRKLIEVKVEQ